MALENHAPLTQWQPLHIHHAASHVTGRVSLLDNNLAELVFDTPLLLADNDRLVLRDISARATLAGGRVVALNPRVVESVSRTIYSGWRRWQKPPTMAPRLLCIFSAER